MLFITALTAAAAQISIPLPFTAVPLTLQPMVVLLGGLALGVAARIGEPDSLSRRRHRRTAGVRGVGHAAARSAAAARTDRRLSDGLSARRVRRGISRRARVRSPIRHVRARDVRRPARSSSPSGVTWLGLFARTAERQRTGWPAVARSPPALYPFILPDLIKLAIAAGLVPALWRLVGRTGAR